MSDDANAGPADIDGRDVARPGAYLVGEISARLVCRLEIGVHDDLCSAIRENRILDFRTMAPSQLKPIPSG
jgi:hypothetical protein